MGFPTGRDSATFRDKGTEVPLLTKRKQDKLRILPRDRTGRDRTSFTVYNVLFLFFNVLLLFFGVFFWNVIVTRDVLGHRSLSRDFCSCPCPRAKGHRTEGQRPVLWKGSSFSCHSFIYNLHRDCFLFHCALGNFFVLALLLCSLFICLTFSPLQVKRPHKSALSNIWLAPVNTIFGKLSHSYPKP